MGLSANSLSSALYIASTVIYPCFRDSDFLAPKIQNYCISNAYNKIENDNDELDDNNVWATPI